MAYYGRRINSGGDTDYGYSGVGSVASQMAQVFNAIPEHGWAYAVGSWGGAYTPDAGSATWRGAIWAVASGTPGTLLGRTGTVTTSTQMTHGSHGTNQLSALEANIMLWSGTQYAIGWNVSAGSYGFAMSQAANNPGGVASYLFYKRNASAPTNPFGSTSTSYEGAIDSFIEYEPNVAPTVTTAGASPTGLITTTSPTFTGSFADANSDRGDKLKQYRILVQRVSDGAVFWDTTLSADSTEQAASAFTEGYAGTALVAGVQYQWIYAVSDQFGVWSSWSAPLYFTVNGGGVVSTSAGSPSGKLETVSPATFTGTWSHVSALATNAVEVRIWQGNAVVRQSGTIGKSVANGGAISVSWAETGFGALSWGVGYAYQIRARDTGNLWSDWSAVRAFTTNASPTIPQLIAPVGNIAMTSRPLLRALSTDVDDTTATGLAVSARIKSAAGAVLFTRAMTWNASAGEWQYQTTATDLASYAQYKWDAVATDGTLTTAYSSEASFVYGQGPVVTITGPTGTITTNTPNVSFTQDSTQASFRVEVYEWVNGAAGSVAVYDSGTLASTASAGSTVFHAIPAGKLHNNTQYVVKVTSTNNLSLVGTQWGTAFTLAFPVMPAPTNLTVSPYMVGNDTQPSALLVSWDDPGYSTTIFRKAFVTRRLEGSPLASAQILAIYTSPAQAIFIDYYPASGKRYTYAVFFIIMQGTDETESAIAEQSNGITLDTAVISNATDGTQHVTLRYGQPTRLAHTKDEARYYPWGQEHAHTVRGTTHEHAYSGTFTLHDDRYSTGLNDLANLRAIDASGATACVRDQYGDVIFGDMSLTERKGQRGEVAEVTVMVTQNDHIEGV